MYTIPNAHNKGVTALDLTSDGSTIVSGGGEGQVRCAVLFSRNFLSNQKVPKIRITFVVFFCRFVSGKSTMLYINLLPF